MSRDKFTISSLDLGKQLDRSVRNSFIQQEIPGKKIALLYPGLRYSCDKPLLHYTTEILLDRGFDVLQLWADYDNPEFQSFSQAEQTVQLIEDGKALLQAGLKSSSYSELILVGKSLGTLTIAFILSQGVNFPEIKTIWFTPLLYLPPVSQSVLELTGPVFIAGSQADQTFDYPASSQLSEKPNIIMNIIEDADHSLEIPGDPIRSTQILSSLMANLLEFLS